MTLSGSSGVLREKTRKGQRAKDREQRAESNDRSIPRSQGIPPTLHPCLLPFALCPFPLASVPPSISARLCRELVGRATLLAVQGAVLRLCRIAQAGRGARTESAGVDRVGHA